MPLSIGLLKKLYLASQKNQEETASNKHFTYDFKQIKWQLTNTPPIN